MISDDTGEKASGSCCGLEPELFDVTAAFRRLMRANRKLMASSVAMADAHPSQVPYLHELAHRPDVSQRELASALHLAPPTVTVMLQKLERDGLIERRTDPADQRLMRIRLTEQGHALDKRLHAAHLEYMRLALGPLSDADRQDLERLLGLVAGNLEAALAARERHDPSDETPAR